MKTIGFFAEQIQRDYARFLHRDDISPTLDSRELVPLIIQATNEVVKAQAMEGFNNGIVDVPPSSIGEYSVALTSVGNIAECTIPVTPIRLPYEMGVWEVFAADLSPNEDQITDPFNPYIPLIQQDAFVFQGRPEAYLEQFVGYYVFGKKLRFTQDITGAPYNRTHVILRLLLNDFGQLDETSIMPVSPDQENQVIERVLQIVSRGTVSKEELNKAEEQLAQTTDMEDRNS